MKELEVILDVVSDYVGLHKNLILSKSRKREFVEPRQICMYISRKLTGYSLTIIGDFFGNKDHATVIHAERLISDLIEWDGKMSFHVNRMLDLSGYKIKNKLPSINDNDRNESAIYMLVELLKSKL